MASIFASLVLLSCATEENQKPDFDASKMIAVQNEMIIGIQAHGVDTDGFMKGILHTGDSFLWQGKWCAIAGCDMALFSEDDSGRYCRDLDCDVHTSDDNGDGKPDSNTGWSGDMGVCGLVPYVLIQNKKEMIQRHVQYGEANDWRMGPIAEGLPFAKQVDARIRVKYSPVLQQHMKNVRDHMEGRGITNLVFTVKSKDDYEAHLQACQIWAQAYMTGESTETMREIVKIHYERVPKSPLYAFLHGYLNGDWDPIKAICESTDIYLGDYIRCDGSSDCGAAERIFACDLAIRAAQKF